MIQGKWYAPGVDCGAVLPVRQAVFGLGPDARDAESWNVLVWEDELPAATGRIWWQDGAYWLGDIGVVPEKRGRKIGDLVLRLLLFKAQSHAAREVRLTCEAELQGFFARLGFQSDPLQPSEMVLPGDRIDLDTCKNCRKEGCPRRIPE